MPLTGKIRQELDGPGGRQLAPEELQRSSYGFHTQEADYQIELWVYQLPDLVRASLHCPSVRKTETTSPDIPETILYGCLPDQKQTISLNQQPPLLFFNHQDFFILTLFPLRYQESRLSHAIVSWVQIDLRLALKYLLVGDFIETIEDISPTLPPAFYGSLANQIHGDFGAVGLFSLLQATTASPYGLPLVQDIEEDISPFSGLHNIFAEENSPSPSQSDVEQLINQLISGDKLVDSLAFKSYERAVKSGELTQAKTIFEENSEHWKYDARAQYSAACLYQNLGEDAAALELFHQSQLLDDHRGYQQELSCHNELARSFRKEYPGVFEQIRRGDRLRTLNTLRPAADKHPLVGNAILSYCLRHSGEAREGLSACDKSLRLNPNQSDVLNNKWSFLLELDCHHECLETALEHGRSYPRDLSATVNLIDSLLLKGSPEKALVFAWRYAIFSSNLQRVIEQFFKPYEALERWQELVELYRELFPLVSGPTGRTLSYYGEALTEAGFFSESCAVFEQALIVEPGNAKVILGYARTLARADQEIQAAALLETALRDEHRIDNLADRALLVTLLAEIHRRSGDPQRALSCFSEEFGDNLLEISRSIGPMPGLEFAESLLELGRTKEAREAVDRLAKDWPNDPFVEELGEIVPQVSEKRYRLNVAAIVLDEQGRILACRRADRNHTWQIPQGGVNPNESPKEALFRELEEEIGTAEVDLLGSLPQTLRYDWPEHVYLEGFCGQEQYYFLVRLRSGEAISLNNSDSPEFDQYEWISAGEFLERITGFKVEVYNMAIRKMQELFPNMIKP